MTEHAFLCELGIGDPALTDYLAEMLCRFLHMDQIYRLRDATGRQLDEVASMLIEAEGLPPEGRTRREIHRHIGDFTLFWTGLFPEALQQHRRRSELDFFVDYCNQGKRSYLIAAAYDGEPYRDESPVLRRLSEEFELCALGLNKVRAELHQGGTSDPSSGLWLQGDDA
ncbi:MAG TPA: hypothetical protein PKD86_05640 [Gemmatales bacterium]|nr:hypothetical protein [Gemmatales bacterium]HMP58816.1 hypothetical protein [Gemmatales bacterium]